MYKLWNHEYLWRATVWKCVHTGLFFVLLRAINLHISVFFQAVIFAEFFDTECKIRERGWFLWAFALCIKASTNHVVLNGHLQGVDMALVFSYLIYNLEERQVFCISVSFIRHVLSVQTNVDTLVCLVLWFVDRAVFLYLWIGRIKHCIWVSRVRRSFAPGLEPSGYISCNERNTAECLNELSAVRLHCGHSRRQLLTRKKTE